MVIVRQTVCDELTTRIRGIFVILGILKTKEILEGLGAVGIDIGFVL